MKRKILITIQSTVLAGALMLSSYTLPAQSVKGNKNVIIKEFSVGDFDAIEAGSVVNVFLQKGDRPLVKIETDENLQEMVTLKITGSTLNINAKSLSSPTKLNAYVTFTELKSLTLSGAAKLVGENVIESPRLDMDVSGAAKGTVDVNTVFLKTDISGAASLTLKGHSETHNTKVSGAAYMDALKLITQNTDIKVSGAARAKVTAIDNITSEVSGAGSLSYFENDGIKTINSPGKVVVTIKGAIDKEKLKLLDVSENGDSAKVKIGNIEVEVLEGKGTNISIGSKKLEVDESGNVKLSKVKKPKFNGHWSGFELGINGLTNKEGSLSMPAGYSFLDLRYEKSTNVRLNLFEQNFNISGQKLGLVTGLGFEWNNFRLRQHNMKIDRNAEVFTAVRADEKAYVKNKIVISYLNAPLMLEFQTNPKSNSDSFHLSAGIIGGLRIGSFQKMEYENGKKQTEKQHDDFFINPFKADALLKIGWGKLNLYGTYSLTPLFRDGKGPELYPFSVGLALLSF